MPGTTLYQGGDDGPGDEERSHEIDGDGPREVLGGCLRDGLDEEQPGVVHDGVGHPAPGEPDGTHTWRRWSSRSPRGLSPRRHRSRSPPLLRLPREYTPAALLRVRPPRGARPRPP